MAVPSGRLTRAERRDHSLKALLDAAAEMIAEHGIEGASLASIAERAGVSRGLPTHYFRSKDSLVGHLARRAQDHIATSVIEALGQAQQRIDELSALERLRATVDVYLDLFDHPRPDERALIVMWGSTFPSSSAVEGMAEADRPSYEGWAELMAAGQREGSIRGDLDPTAAAVVLQGLLRGVAASLMADSKVADIEAVRQTCHFWITAALAPSSSDRGRTVKADRRPAQGGGRPVAARSAFAVPSPSTTSSSP